MTDGNHNEVVPQSSDKVADSLAELTLAIIANHKAGGGAVVEASADVMAAVSKLSGALAAVSGVGAEISAEPIGVIEAFVLAGFKVGRTLTGK